jgi:hypothetical protein
MVTPRAAVLAGTLIAATGVGRVIAVASMSRGGLRTRRPGSAMGACW